MAEIDMATGSGQQQQQRQDGDEDNAFGDVPISVPQTLGDDSDNSDLLGDGSEEDDEPDELDELRRGQEELQRQLQEKDEAHQNLMMQMAMQQRQAPADQQQAQQQAAQAGVDLEDLPDPVENPKDFKKALGERITQVSTAQQQTAAQQQQHNQALQELDNKFRSNYSDLADKEMLFQTAAKAEADRYRSMGIDPRQAATMQPDRFLKGVADRMYNELGIDPADNSGEDEDDDAGDGPEVRTNKRPQQQQQRRQSKKRTAGVSSGSRPKARRNKQEKQPKSFTEQLKQRQLDEGLL